MGKLTDLTSIYETYKQEVIQELNIGIMSDAPGLGSRLNSKPSHSDNLKVNIPGQAEEEQICNMCGQADCKCNSGCSSCGKSDCSCNNQEDSNLSMAKSEVFKILKAANELMNRLQTSEKVEPWQLSKLVKASDYLCNVNSSVEYDEFEKCQQDLNSGINDINKGMVVVSKIKDMLASEDLTVNEEVLKNVIFNIECLVEK
jgi:hypothetical protein